MSKKEFTEQERFEIAQTLYNLIGLDIDLNEEQAIYDAIHIISPEFADAIDERDKELEDEYYVMRIADMLGLENQATEQPSGKVIDMAEWKKKHQKEDE